MVVFLTEIMPADVRTTGFALAYSLATAIFAALACDQHLPDLRHRNRGHSWVVASFAAACGL